MAAADQTRIKRHYVKERTETQLLLNQPPQSSPLRPNEARVEEQLARIIARLAMNIDCSGIIRRQPVIQPERICKPAVGFGKDDQIAGARMIEPDLLPLGTCQNSSHSRQSRKEIADRGTIF